MLIIKTKDIEVFLKSKFILIVKKNLTDIEAREIKGGDQGHLGINEGCKSRPTQRDLSMREGPIDLLVHKVPGRYILTRSWVQSIQADHQLLVSLKISAASSALGCSQVGSPSWPTDGPEASPDSPPARGKNASCS